MASTRSDGSGGSSPGGSVGAAAREARAAALDAFLAGLVPGLPDGVALVAVGGLGRRECAPYSDLDLLLLHAEGRLVAELAGQLWYPIWDARLSLDHSVRTVVEALTVARDDPAVALGLLDARHLAGDPSLTGALAAAARDQWRRTASQALPRLREATEARHRHHGELAFLLEGDLKEAAGGLRDVGVLRGIGYAGVADALRPAVRAAHTRLLDVRDALHLTVRRRVDRLLAQEGAPVATLLGLHDRDALLRRVSCDARTVAHALADAWRAVRRWQQPRRSTPAPRRPVARDVVACEGEVVLARTAIEPRPDPTLSLRVAAAAATAGLPISRATGEWLASHCPPLPQPWPLAARDAFLALLGSGLPLVPTWEDCDRYGLVVGWLPEWSRLRGAPQHHPVHRFTLDRHLVQAAAEAARFTRQVARPDLLVLGALLHDVGKVVGAPPGRPQEATGAAEGIQGVVDARQGGRREATGAAAGRSEVVDAAEGDTLEAIGAVEMALLARPPDDHAEAGVPVAAAIATRIGLGTADVAVVSRLVRLHLLLPDVATRRDLSDPKTISSVATLVGEAGTLALLHALARADASATGPAAWSPWKDRLVAELVSRVGAVLRGGRLPALPAPDPGLVAGPLPAVHLDGDRVAVAAADRRGLLAGVAGCLATHRLAVVSADAAIVAGRALVQFVVQPRFGVRPDPARLAADLRRVATGDGSILERLRPSSRRPSGRYPPAGGSGGTPQPAGSGGTPQLAGSAGAPPRSAGSGAPPRVVWHRQAATGAVIVELRATDAPGLLYRAAAALDEVGAEVRAARVATLGADVVDAFYLVGSWPDAAAREKVETALLAAAGSQTGALA